MPSPANFLRGYLPYLLRRADQSLSGAFHGVLSRNGVARSEWRVLAVLADLGEMPVLELAAASLSPQPTVTQAVRRLEDRGLVSRVRGADDKRQRFVSITATGSELAARLIAEAERLEAEALADAGDLSNLIAQLVLLTEVVERTAKARGDLETG